MAKREAMECRHGCFLCTDWEIFTEDHSLEESVLAVTKYILFCEDLLISDQGGEIISPTQTESQTDTGNFCGWRPRGSKKTIRKQITLAKHQYKQKVEGMFTSGNLRQAWKGLATLIGQTKQNKKQPKDSI